MNKMKLPITPEAVVLLNSRIGQALWQTQGFEDSLAHYLTMVLKLPPKVAIQEAEQILDNVRKGTLGKLINEFKLSTKIDSNLEKRLDTFLKERNWLVHKSRRLHHADIYHEKKFLILLKRLDALSDEALALNKLFGRVIEEWVLAKGIPKEKIDHYANDILRKWIS